MKKFIESAGWCGMGLFALMLSIMPTGTEAQLFHSTFPDVYNLISRWATGGAIVWVVCAAALAIITARGK